MFAQCLLDVRMIAAVFVFADVRQIQQMLRVFVQQENVAIDIPKKKEIPQLGIETMQMRLE